MSTRDNPYPFTFLSEDIIDLSNLNYDDEETWLYVSSSRNPENETFDRNIWLEESRRELHRMDVVGNSPGGELCSNEVNTNYEIADNITFPNIQLMDMSCGDNVDVPHMDFAIGAPTAYNNLESSYISFRSMSPPSLVGSFMEHMDSTAAHDITYFKGEPKSPTDRTFIQSTNDRIMTNKISSPTANYAEKSVINKSNISLKENTFIKPHRERSSECLLNVTYDFNCLSDLSLSNNFSKTREINQDNSTGNTRRSVCMQKKIEAEMSLAARGGSIDSLDGISSESDISASPVSPRPLNLEDVQERARLQEQSLMNHISTPVRNVVRSVVPDDSLLISPILREDDEKSPPNTLTAVDKLNKGNPHFWQPQNDRQNLLNRTLTRNSKTSDINTTQNISRKVDNPYCESLNQSLKELNVTHNLDYPCEGYTNLNETKELHARKNLSVKLNAMNTTYDAESVSDKNAPAPPAIPKISRLPPPSKLIRPTSRHSLRSSPSPPTVSPSPPTVLPEKAQSAHCSPICSPHGSSQNLTTKVPQFQSQRDLKNLGKPLTMIPQYGSEKQLYKRDLQLRSLRPPSTTRSKLVQPTKLVPNQITTDNINQIENKTAEELKLIKPIPKRPSGLPQPAVRPSGLPRPRTGIPRMPFTRTAPSYQNGLQRFGAPRRNIDDF